MFKALIPTEPDINDPPHWFFNIGLFVGGSIHTFMSLLMVIIFFILNGPDFKFVRLLKYLRSVSYLESILNHYCSKFYWYIRILSLQ